MPNHVFGRSMRHVPPKAVAGDGCYLVDADGKRYLDGSGGAAVSFGAPVFFDHNRLGARGVDEPAELVLRVAGRHGFHGRLPVWGHYDHKRVHLFNTALGRVEPR